MAITTSLRRAIARFDQMPKTDLSKIDFSFDPKLSIERLRRHQWRKLDLHYAFLAFLLFFAFCIAQAPVLFKLAFAAFLGTLLLVPILSQFFLPFLPVATWLIFFFSARFIPADYRPPISVRVLPALENILYGANISNILAKHTNPVLDVLGWLPYGVIHFGAPFACSAVMFIFGPPLTVPIFAISFGYMNIIGVIIQILFPCSPPWYENLYGLAPANYGMPGSPGGLARIDQLFGTSTYTSTFTASPMVFGAFPSLHSGSATIEALFLAHCFPRFRRYFFAYVLWIWWSTMYLTHHYFVDLIGGSMLAAGCYYVARRYFLPRVDPTKLTRFEYETVTLGDPSGDWASRIRSDGQYDPVDMEGDDADGWAHFNDSAAVELDDFDIGEEESSDDLDALNLDDEQRIGSSRRQQQSARRGKVLAGQSSRVGRASTTGSTASGGESDYELDGPSPGLGTLSRQSSIASVSITTRRSVDRFNGAGGSRPLGASALPSPSSQHARHNGRVTRKPSHLIRNPPSVTGLAADGPVSAASSSAAGEDDVDFDSSDDMTTATALTEPEIDSPTGRALQQKQQQQQQQDDDQFSSAAETDTVSSRPMTATSAGSSGPSSGSDRASTKRSQKASRGSGGRGKAHKGAKGKVALD
ncbi:Phosphatidylinositol:ceramide phosphoinositol transferase (IPC synthase) [Savitreella phatthalungensis]